MKKEFIERRNELTEQAQRLLDGAVEARRALTEEERKTFEQLQQQVKALDDTIAADEQLRTMQDLQPKAQEGENKRSAEQAEADSFEAYIRGTLNERDSNMTLADNGAVIPKTIAAKIIKRVYDVCPVLERSTKYNVKGTLEIPYYDESEQAITVAYANEFTSLTSGVGKFTSVTLTGHLAGALSLISRSLINNTAFDLTGFVVNQMADSIARFIEQELLVGTPGKVTGLSDLTNVKTAAAADKITGNELIELQGMVKDIYQANAIWVMSPATRTALRCLKDDVGRYLLTEDLTSPFGVTLLGKPVYVSDAMEDMAAGKRTVYYGDFSGLATKFAEDVNIQVLREKYADVHAVGVIGWLEFDAKVEDAQKLACLQMKA